jgi:hypothetical protein
LGIERVFSLNRIARLPHYRFEHIILRTFFSPPLCFIKIVKRQESTRISFDTCLSFESTPRLRFLCFNDCFTKGTSAKVLRLISLCFPNVSIRYPPHSTEFTLCFLSSSSSSSSSSRSNDDNRLVLSSLNIFRKSSKETIPLNAALRDDLSDISLSSNFPLKTPEEDRVDNDERYSLHGNDVVANDTSTQRHSPLNDDAAEVLARARLRRVAHSNEQPRQLGRMLL